MDNPDKNNTGTQFTGRRQTKEKTQHTKTLTKMSNKNPTKNRGWAYHMGYYIKIDVQYML
jgi:hypothetical protein